MASLWSSIMPNFICMLMTVVYASKLIAFLSINEGLNKDLQALDTWLKGNKLSLSVTKTQSMTISTNHKQDALERKNVQLNLQMRNETL